MKNIARFVFKIATLSVGVAVMANFASCQKKLGEEQCVVRSGVEVSFKSTIITTRATNGLWEAGDKIGVFMIKNSDASVMNQNMRFVAEADNNAKVDFVADGNDQKIFFPEDVSQKVDFIAYYPYASLVGGKYKINTLSQSSLNQIDLLYSDNKAVAKDKNAPAVELELKHKLSSLKFNVSASEGITDAQLAGLIVTIKGMHTKADFDPLTGTMDNESDVADVVAKTQADGKKSAAIVIPNGAFAGREFQFKLAGMDNPLVHQIPLAETFESGKEYTINVEVKKTGLDLSIKMLPWEDGGTTTISPK